MTKKILTIQERQQAERLLATIGLAPNEAKLYLTALRLGAASAIHLAKTVKVSRQMIYVILPKLIKQGLIKKIEISNREIYQAVNPEILEDRAESIKRQIRELVPVLKSEQAENYAVPFITIYENPLSMREWYRKYMKQIKKGEELLVWSTGRARHWFELDREFYERYLDVSSDEGIKTYVILPDNAESRKHQKAVGRPMTKWRYLGEGWGGNAEKWIWRDEICFLTIRENATNMVVMESKALAELEKFDFWRIWHSVKVRH